MANKVIVIGGGLAGLMASMRAAEAGMEVQIFSEAQQTATGT